MQKTKIYLLEGSIDRQKWHRIRYYISPKIAKNAASFRINQYNYWRITQFDLTNPVILEEESHN